MKKYLFTILYSLILACFTAWLLLDMFVFHERGKKQSGNAGITFYPDEMSVNTTPTVTISEVTPTPEITYKTDLETTTEPTLEYETTPEPAYTPTPESPVITDSSYVDEHIKIGISKYREYNSNIYICDITLDSPDMLKVALTYYKYTTDLAEQANAIIAINGDMYRERTGYCIRDGEILRSSVALDSKSRINPGQEDVCLFKDGHMEVIKEGEESAEELLARGARHVWDFGPALIVDGKNVFDSSDNTGIMKSVNPRTAFGIIDELHYVFIVVDGRTSEDRGVTGNELTEIGMGLGVKILYNLDGGRSSALYFNGELVNIPSGGSKSMGEREVNDIIYIGY